MRRAQSRNRAPGRKTAVARPAPAPAPAPAPVPAHPLTRIKEFCNNPAAAALLPHFQRWKILPQFPTNFLIYAGIIDLTRTKAYHRPIITNDGRSTRADYFMDTSGNKTPLKQISSILFFYAEMVYIHAPIGNTNYLIATPTRMVSDIHKITTVAHKALAGAPPASISPTESTNRQIHWIYTPTTTNTKSAITWLELNPDYIVHMWRTDDTPMVRDLADHTNIKIHDAADFRTTIFSWLEDHSSLRAEEMFAVLWENCHDLHAARVISAYARNILLAAQGGFYADCAETVCLVPLAAILGSPAIFMAAEDSGLGTYFMAAPTVGDHDAWNDVVVKSVESVLDAYSSIYDSDLIAKHADMLVSKSHLPQLHAELGLPITLVPYSNLQQGCLLSIIGHVGTKETSLIESLLANMLEVSGV